MTVRRPGEMMGCGRARSRAVRLVLLAVLGTCCGQSDECNRYEKCDDCIAGGDCVWCPDLPPFSGPRCTSPQNYNCSSQLEDPQAPPPTSLRNDPLGETVQITPQEINLYLRTGRPQTFTLTVKPSRNYPLDMYFLMDLSGSQEQDLETLRNLSTAITEQLTDIAPQFTLGFGSFVDKIAYPFASTLQDGRDYLEYRFDPRKIVCANGRDSCEPTYTYRHHLSLTRNNSQFTDILTSATIRGNLDSPEAMLDALLQSAVCVNDVGWREQSLRIVVVLSDAGFKTALDGKVAALVLPNDGECHLQTVELVYEGTFLQYFRDPEQDFPSIYQVREKLIENDIITVFAVADEGNATVTQDLYSVLSQELGTSRTFVQRIRSDGSDILGVISQAYDSVTQDIVVEDVPGLKLAVTPVSNCTLTDDGMGCADVSLEQEVQFNVTVTMEQCPSGGANFTSSLLLPGFGSVLLHIEPICECDCSSNGSEEHAVCNNGLLVCGLCDCGESRFGEQCECDRPFARCRDDCFHRGDCDNCTLECTCNTMPVKVNDMGMFKILGSYGDRCQCSNESSGGCPTGLSDLPCSGPDRGVCQCSDEQCDCSCECSVAVTSQRSYFGDGCSCNPDDCYNEQYPNRLCAYIGAKDSEDGEDGTCDDSCKGCQCPSDTVAYNKTCLHEDTLCERYVECAKCWPNNCTTTIQSGADCTPNSLDDITHSGTTVSCLFEQNDCVVDYDVVLSGPNNIIVSVYVGEERDCDNPSAQLAWIIAVSIIGGILLLGVLILTVAKIILLVVDRKEYKKFLNDMNTGDFTPHNNPLYVTPQEDYSNPTLHKRSSTEKDPDD